MTLTWPKGLLRSLPDSEFSRVSAQQWDSRSTISEPLFVQLGVFIGNETLLRMLGLILMIRLLKIKCLSMILNLMLLPVQVAQTLRQYLLPLLCISTSSSMSLSTPLRRRSWLKKPSRPMRRLMRSLLAVPLRQNACAVTLLRSATCAFRNALLKLLYLFVDYVRRHRSAIFEVMWMELCKLICPL
mmetsp:Transcript_35750/g.78276  ORF Transcript_35750/g.78276 Transcript_35750/m.78276 type:complete len:186 (-) Transcript_35750:166-723(-)